MGVRAGAPSRCSLRAEPATTNENSPEVRRLVIDGVEARRCPRSEKEHFDTGVRSAEASFSRSSVCSPTRPRSRTSTTSTRTSSARDVVRIRLYYWKRGYRDTEVDTIGHPHEATTGSTSPSRSTRDLPTRVREVAINYDSALISDKTRNRLTLLRANDPLDLIRLDSMRVLFQDELWDRGYGDAVVDTTSSWTRRRGAPTSRSR